MTIQVCDCFGNTGRLFECQKELRTWKGFRQHPQTWELCEDCIEHLEDTLVSEIQRVAAWKKKRGTENDRSGTS